MPSTTPALNITGKRLIDWGGALRWYKTTQDAATLFAAAQAAGGHATRWRGDAEAQLIFQPLPAPLHALHRRLKQAFDPRGIFNLGRMYPDI